MTLQESIRQCFLKYAEFNGRASRAEYGWLFLFVVLAGGVLAALSNKPGGAFYFATLLPSLAAASRLLHDTGHSGWWQLVALVPLVGLIALPVFLTHKRSDAPEVTGAAP